MLKSLFIFHQLSKELNASMKMFTYSNCKMYATEKLCCKISLKISLILKDWGTDTLSYGF